MTGKFGIVAALAAMAVLGLWLACARSAAKEAVYPVENGCKRFSVAVSSRIEGFFSGAEACAENERLKRENDLLRMSLADAERLAAENARLCELLELDSDKKTFSRDKWITAPVLSRGGAAGMRTLLRVGRGSAHGVATNAVVAVPGGLVGRIEGVTSNTADVRLITDPSVKVSCRIEFPDASVCPVRGILSGSGTRSCGSSLLYVIEPLRIRHLKRQPYIPQQARVVTTGLGGVYPPGLTVGFLVDEQDASETALEREGDVMPAVDFSSLEYVFICREN